MALLAVENPSIVYRGALQKISRFLGGAWRRLPGDVA
jgi:hypothetical protein